MSEAAQRQLEQAVELDRVHDAIGWAVQFVEGHDRASAAQRLEDRTQPSALRTKLEHAHTAAGRIAEWLRDEANRAMSTPPHRDQGPA